MPIDELVSISASLIGTPVAVDSIGSIRSASHETDQISSRCAGNGCSWSNAGQRLLHPARGLNNDDSEAVADSEWTEVVQPPPTAIFVEPIYVPIRPSFAPLPVATRSGSGTGTQTSPQPSQRDIGSQRSGSSSGQASSSTPVRSNGSTRGGR